MEIDVYNFILYNQPIPTPKPPTHVLLRGQRGLGRPEALVRLGGHRGGG